MQQSKVGHPKSTQKATAFSRQHIQGSRQDGGRCLCVCVAATLEFKYSVQRQAPFKIHLLLLHLSSRKRCQKAMRPHHLPALLSLLLLTPRNVCGHSYRFAQLLLRCYALQV